MTPGPADTAPPTDAGTDTLERFHFQALLTLPLCVACVVEKQIRRVIPEHLEDVAVEYPNCWRFIQIKSRDPERGPWTLRDVLEEGHGALRSLYRTHLLTQDVNATLELWLEGAISVSSPIRELRARGNRSDGKLVQRVSEALGISTADTQTFLSRVVLSPPVSARESIVPVNLLLLNMHSGGHLTHTAVQAVHDALVQRIEHAMRAERTGPQWPKHVIHPDDLQAEWRSKLEAKTLCREQLAELLQILAGPARPFLRRATEVGAAPIGDLERKMIQAGGDGVLIEQARALRMRTVEYRSERAAANMFPDEDQLEDVRQRLLVHALGPRGVHAGKPNAASLIWSALVPQLETHAANIDKDGCFAKDAMFLLGELCEISDQCRFDWGG